MSFLRDSAALLSHILNNQANMHPVMKATRWGESSGKIPVDRSIHFCQTQYYINNGLSHLAVEAAKPWINLSGFRFESFYFHNDLNAVQGVGKGHS